MKDGTSGNIKIKMSSELNAQSPQVGQIYNIIFRT